MEITEKGAGGTDKTLELAVKKAKELDLNHIVVASHTGNTALKLFETKEKMQGKFEIICVTHHTGFKENGVNEMPEAVRNELLNKGLKVLTTTHLMAGLDRALRNKFGGLYPAEIIANTLRIFGQGVKVSIEAAGMALDANMLPFGKEIIAIGGHGKGADTAVIIVPAHSHYFFDTKVKEIICRPRDS